VKLALAFLAGLIWTVICLRAGRAARKEGGTKEEDAPICGRRRWPRRQNRRGHRLGKYLAVNGAMWRGEG
jgi:hypothetical protein